MDALSDEQRRSARRTPRGSNRLFPTVTGGLALLIAGICLQLAIPAVLTVLIVTSVVSDKIFPVDVPQRYDQTAAFGALMAGVSVPVSAIVISTTFVFSRSMFRRHGEQRAAALTWAAIGVSFIPFASGTAGVYFLTLSGLKSEAESGHSGMLVLPTLVAAEAGYLVLSASIGIVVWRWVDARFRHVDQSDPRMIP